MSLSRLLSPRRYQILTQLSIHVFRLSEIKLEVNRTGYGRVQKQTGYFLQVKSGTRGQQTLVSINSHELEYLL